MTGIALAQKVVAEGTCHLARPRIGEPGQYDAKPFTTGGNKRGWFYLDLFTSSAITKVHKALNETNQEKFAGLPIEKMARVAMQLVSVGGAK